MSTVRSFKLTHYKVLHRHPGHPFLREGRMEGVSDRRHAGDWATRPRGGVLNA